jgi:hypothetical protein
MKRALTAILALLTLAALTYAGDYLSLRYQVPNRPQFSPVQRNDMYVIHTKGAKIQYEPGPIETDQCVHSFFPHFGCQPCWYLTRHTDKLIDI